MRPEHRWVLVVMVGAVGVAGVIAQVVAGLGLDDYVFMPTALAIALVGMLLVIRVPGNAISWLLSGRRPVQLCSSASPSLGRSPLQSVPIRH